MSKFLKIFSLAFCFFSFTLLAYAQSNTIKINIDSTHLWIGQQTKLNVEVTANQNAELHLPVPNKFIMPGVEVLDISKIDTTDIGNNRMRIDYNLLITSFDEDLYAIPPFPLVSGTDTVYSNSLALKIVAVPIDTANMDKFFDIKDVISPPLVFKDYVNYILYPLLIALVIVVLILIYFYGIKRKPIAIFTKKEEPLLPPHIVALKELDSIKAKKLWQQGRTKEYHSEITDTLRSYIERRFNVQAMEMTAGEILERMKGISDADNVVDKLKQILLLGDLVKFAKYQALPDENELSLLNAYLFVNETKIEELNKEDEQSKLENKDSKDIKTVNNEEVIDDRKITTD